MNRSARLLFILFLASFTDLPSLLAQSAQVLLDYPTSKAGSTSYIDSPEGVTADSSGNLYGVNPWGGNTANCKTVGCGQVFEMVSPGGSWGTWTRKVIYSFIGGTDGCSPQGQLTIDSSGAIYGMTAGSNCKRSASIFKLTKSSSGTWTLETLGTTSSFWPSTPFALDSKGNLYMATSTGAVELVKPTTTGGKWQSKQIATIAGNPGWGITYSGGNLYGITATGGSGLGSVFELTPSSSGKWTLTTLTSFAGTTDGYGPDLWTTGPGISVVNTGEIWGIGYAKYAYNSSSNGYSPVCTKAGGCGTVYHLVKQSNGAWKRTTVHQFLSDGAPPYALTVSSDGNHVLGATSSGGTAKQGSIFHLLAPTTTNGAWTMSSYSLVYNKYHGVHPDENVVLDAEGLGIYLSHAYSCNTSGNSCLVDVTMLTLGTTYTAAGTAACIKTSNDKGNVKLTNTCSRRVDFWECAGSAKSGYTSCSTTKEVGYFFKGYLNSGGSGEIQVAGGDLIPFATVVECKSGWYPIAVYDKLGIESLDCAQPLK